MMFFLVRRRTHFLKITVICNFLNSCYMLYLIKMQYVTRRSKAGMFDGHRDVGLVLHKGSTVYDAVQQQYPFLVGR